MPRVSVITPDGTEGTVEESELGLMPPGTQVTSGQRLPSEDDAATGGTLGTIAAGILGAGSSATLGKSDQLLNQGAAVVGGKSFQKEVQRNLKTVREENPKAEFAGEIAGLIANPGAVEGLGTTAEEMVGPRVGEGLVGSIAKSAARNAVESVVLGRQHQVTEESLGDPQQSAEAMFSSLGKDALLGAGLGVGLGALGYGGSKVGELTGLIGKRPGPIGSSTLDELAGAEGAGREVYANARRTEDAIDGIKRTGATTEQAAKAVDEFGTMGKAAGQSEDSLAQRALKWASDQAADIHGGERSGILKQHFEDVLNHSIESEAAVDARARKLADLGTQMMRHEEELNRINFLERPERFAKMTDPARFDAARDAAVAMGQDAKAIVGELGILPTRSYAIGRLGNHLKEFEAVIDHLPTEGGQRGAGEAMMAAYKLKQAVGDFAGFGKAPQLRTPEENALGELYERLRVGLEDENAFADAARANKDWNEAFTDKFGRRQDAGRRFSVSIDQQSGDPRPEFDAGKIKGLLNQLGGAEADQPVKSLEGMLDWMRSRAAKIEQYGDLTPAEKATFEKGKAAQEAFAKELRTAMAESEAANRVRDTAFAERGHGAGGLVGIGTDIFTRPATTQARLATIARTLKSFEDGVRKGIRRFVGGEGAAVGSAATHAKPRPRETIIKDIETVRGLAANPAALEEAAQRMVGDTSKYAPQVANQLRLTAMRTLLYLAREAPPASTTQNGILGKPTPRYSDIQVHDWETKRNASFDVRTLPDDLKRGKLNRDAIEAAEFAQPKLFARMQEIAIDELQQMAAKGQLEKMPYEEKAAIASLLKIAPDETWTPQFMAVLQKSKQQPAQSADATGVPPGALPKKSNQKPIADLFMTESARIEGATT